MNIDKIQSFYIFKRKIVLDGLRLCFPESVRHMYVCTRISLENSNCVRCVKLHLSTYKTVEFHVWGICISLNFFSFSTGNTMDTCKKFI